MKRKVITVNDIKQHENFIITTQDGTQFKSSEFRFAGAVPKVRSQDFIDDDANAVGKFPVLQQKTPYDFFTYSRKIIDVEFIGGE